MLWRQARGCGGCTMLLLGQGIAAVAGELARAGIHPLRHPSPSDTTGVAALDLDDPVAADAVPLDIVVVKAAVSHGRSGGGPFQSLCRHGSHPARLGAASHAERVRWSESAPAPVSAAFRPAALTRSRGGLATESGGVATDRSAPLCSPHT
jgi:hypothetical protein